jgi:nickel transport system substrate-binding protein
MAIDRPTLVATVFGPHADVPVGAVTRMSWIASDSVRQLPFDTAAAARDLDALLWRLAPGARVRTRGGQPLRFTALVPTTSRTRQEAAVLVQAQLRQVGVEMRILPLEYAVFDRRMRAGDFDIVFFSRTLDPSPAMLAQFWATRAIGAENAGAYASPAFDSLVTAAAAAPDRAGALPLWRAALERLNDDAAAVFLFSPRNNAAVHRRFTHVVIRPDSWLAEAATWTVPPERRLARDR